VNSVHWMDGRLSMNCRSRGNERTSELGLAIVSRKRGITFRFGPPMDFAGRFLHVFPERGAPFGFVEYIGNPVAFSHDAEFCVELVGNIEPIVRDKARETKHDSSGARNRPPPRTDGSNRIPSPRPGQKDVVIAGVRFGDELVNRFHGLTIQLPGTEVGRVHLVGLEDSAREMGDQHGVTADVYDLSWNTNGLASVIGDLFAAQGRLPSARGPAPQVPGSLSRG
jgi:hypothetical protein